MPLPVESEHNLDVGNSLKLDNHFISLALTFMDHAKANDNFIDDLESSIIRHRQLILKDFEEEILNIINRDNEPQTIALGTPAGIKTKLRPVFKEDIADRFLNLIKE